MTTPTVSIDAAAAGSDFSLLLFDNSTLAGNSYVVIRKITVQWFTSFVTDTQIHAAVLKKDESAAAESLDSEAVIRDLQEDKQMIRNLGFFSTHSVPGMAARPVAESTWTWRKTIVMKNLRIGPDDDIKFNFTNVDATSGTNVIRALVRVWWRSVA